MSSLKYWIWLSTLQGVGSVTAAKLLNHFGSPENIYNAGPGDYHNIPGVKPAELRSLSNKNTDYASKVLASCDEISCKVLTLNDPEYPERLRNIYDPPTVLYIHGTLPAIDDEPVVAVVGTRDCTLYGISAAESTGYSLATNGLIVVTGLARGVDSAATVGALRGGGRVLAVIGSGLDVIYPPENKKLFSDVIRSGAILSEYAPGTPAIPSNFPIRNRILSGLSLGVAVIEAPKRSGALITAERALEQGRDVFALPGNVDARSCEGSNLLLREGAIPFMKGEDIIGEYAELYPDKIYSRVSEPSSAGTYSTSDGNQRQSDDRDHSCGDKKEIDNSRGVDYIVLDKILNRLTGDEKAVAAAIGHMQMHVDDIISGTGLPAERVLAAITMLEISGCATRDSSGKCKLVEEV